MAEMTRCPKCKCPIKVKKLEDHKPRCVSGRWSHQTHQRLKKQQKLQKAS